MNLFLASIRRFGRIFAALIASFLMAAPRATLAVVPIPDFVVYGTVAIQDEAVTNSQASTNVVIQATRLSDGATVASYQMGSSTNQGMFFYIVRIPMEDAPASSPLTTEPNSPLVFTVEESGVVQLTSTNVPASSSTVQRLDFGPSVDTTGDGIPDAWQIANGIVPGHLGDADGDGMSDYAEYIAGTSPTNASSIFQLKISETDTNTSEVSFQALLAEGVGYEGRSRYYALEVNTNISTPDWNTVPNYSRVLGTNQTVIYALPNTGTPEWFRARVWLEGP